MTIDEAEILGALLIRIGWVLNDDPILVDDVFKFNEDKCYVYLNIFDEAEWNICDFGLLLKDKPLETIIRIKYDLYNIYVVQLLDANNFNQLFSIRSTCTDDLFNEVAEIYDRLVSKYKIKKYTELHKIIKEHFGI
jgi:hypothetical protein